MFRVLKHTKVFGEDEQIASQDHFEEPLIANLRFFAENWLSEHKVISDHIALETRNLNALI
jgi:hypothetical protein